MRCGSFSYRLSQSSSGSYYPNDSDNSGLNCAVSLVLGRDLRPTVDLVRDPGWDVYDFDGIGSDRCRFRDFGEGGQEGGSRPPAVEGINGGKIS